MNGYQIRIPYKLRNLETDRVVDDYVQVDFIAKDDDCARAQIEDVFSTLFAEVELRWPALVGREPK